MSVITISNDDKILNTVIVGGWIVQTREDADGRQYQLLIPPQPEVEDEQSDT